jgi:hypothetical protein
MRQYITGLKCVNHKAHAKAKRNPNKPGQVRNPTGRNQWTRKPAPKPDFWGWRRRKANRTRLRCENCGKAFWTTQPKTARYCGKSCQQKAYRKRKTRKALKRKKK